MPSPFPGMNPYLEQADAWQDFHQSFIPLIRGVLKDQVTPKYIVKVEEPGPPTGRRRPATVACAKLWRGSAHTADSKPICR